MLIENYFFNSFMFLWKFFFPHPFSDFSVKMVYLYKDRKIWPNDQMAEYCQFGQNFPKHQKQIIEYRDFLEKKFHHFSVVSSQPNDYNGFGKFRPFEHSANWDSAICIFGQIPKVFFSQFFSTFFLLSFEIRPFEVTPILHSNDTYQK
jgi:hypothetical protein